MVFQIHLLGSLCKVIGALGSYCISYFLNAPNSTMYIQVLNQFYIFINWIKNDLRKNVSFNMKKNHFKGFSEVKELLVDVS